LSEATIQRIIDFLGYVLEQVVGSMFAHICMVKAFAWFSSAINGCCRTCQMDWMILNYPRVTLI